MNWTYHFFGLGNLSGSYYGFWSGVGSDISELAIVGALFAMLRKMIVHHRERMAQAALQHKEDQDQSERHHRAHLALAEKHHSRLADHLNAQHEAMRAHLQRGFGQVVAQADANAQRAADGPARGGAGSNPAKSEGLPAEGPAVPPPAARKVRQPRQPRTHGTSRGGDAA